jgi:hypothetical protein
MADMVRELPRKRDSDSRTWYDCQFAPFVRTRSACDTLETKTVESEASPAGTRTVLISDLTFTQW